MNVIGWLFISHLNFVEQNFAVVTPKFYLPSSLYPALSAPTIAVQPCPNTYHHYTLAHSSTGLTVSPGPTSSCHWPLLDLVGKHHEYIEYSHCPQTTSWGPVTSLVTAWPLPRLISLRSNMILPCIDYNIIPQWFFPCVWRIFCVGRGWGHCTLL